MCGIFGLINNSNNFSKDVINKCFEKGKNRGPENSSINLLSHKVTFGFHRLAINGLDPISDQPITVNNVTLICNGEIYNYKKLYKDLNITPKTNSDCEVIIYLYLRYGIKQTLLMLDGVFSFMLYDRNDMELPIYIARDPFGVRSLYQMTANFSSHNNTTKKVYGFASEMKCLTDLYSESIGSVLTQFKPGTYSKLYLNINKAICDYEMSVENEKYFMLPFSYDLDKKIYTEKVILNTIYDQMCNAVKKRVENTEREVACLLSGGLDSSLITGLVCKFNPNITEKIKTFSIGLPGSEDLKHAKQVSEYLKTEHYEVIVSEDDMFNAIPEVIEKIESYDTTTVRASVGNYLVSKYIKENSQAKVIFNGDGSDEITGGYMYFHEAPDEYEFDSECRRLLKDIYTFDVLRSDKTISSNGLEARTPFLDRSFVQFYLSLPPSLRYHPKDNNCEKFLLRKAFENRNVIPDSVLWRTKEAFSDGVSGDKKSWYQIIDDKIVEKFGTKYDNDNGNTYLHNPPTTREQRYYRDIFYKLYPRVSNIIPYFWMPRFIDANDSSARTLDIYKEKQNNNNESEQNNESSISKTLQ